MIVGSYVPEGVAAAHFVMASARGATAFYDIDTPVTLALLERGDCAYLSPDLIPAFDLYLSFTGGPTLERLMRRYGSPAARALYCSVDPAGYPLTATPKRWDLSYLGTYSVDRQPALDRLLLSVAREAPHGTFAVAGPLYPKDIRWPDNVERFEHVPPGGHAAFYAASRFTLNVTRADMIRAGYSPSVRLFEAAACGTPVISDAWDGLDTVFEPGREILIAADGGRARGPGGDFRGECRRIGEAARRRVLKEHTAAHRAETLEALLHDAIRRRQAGASRAVPSSVSRELRPAAEEARDKEVGSHEERNQKARPRFGRGRIPRLAPLRGAPRRWRGRRRRRQPQDRAVPEPAQSRARAAVRFRQADIIKPLPRALNGGRRRIDRIYNLACAASPPHYQADPEHTMLTSVVGTHNLLSLAEASGARFFLASTSEIYGDPEVHPQNESYWGNVNPNGPRACYDEGKRAAETLTFDFERAGRVDVRVARIFNTYGPRMRHDDGRVVSNVICQALAGDDITVYGDGRQTRSFCYVSDLIDGFLRLMEYEGALPGAVNLGNPNELTIGDLVRVSSR